MKEMELTSLLAEVESREEELLDLVKDLVSFPTTSPPARNAKEAQDYVTNYLHQLEFEIDRWNLYDNDPIVVGKKRGADPSSKRLIINGHLDVAAIEEGQVWKFDPFTCVVTDERLYGRGVADMKAGMAGALFALRLLHEHGIEPEGDVMIQSVVGEEVGEAGTKSCCDKGYDADLAIVVDTSNCEIQGQGGVITGWITVESPTTFHDATRRSMIHAGGGLYGASAIEKMMLLLQGLQSLERHWGVTKQSDGFPPGSTTINPAVIRGGQHAAFIADRCELWITVHYYPEEHYEDVVKEIEEHLHHVAMADPWLQNHPPTFTWGGTSMIEDEGEIFPSFSIDQDHYGVQLLAQAHEQMFQEPVNYSMSPTVTDGGWLAEAGIPTVLYGPGTLEQAHAVNESLDRDQFLKFTKTMVSFLYKWYQQKN
ncbi:acetylornithine deacetylase [Pontibacillus litoralis]|uniref:Acetylornithine deacetylase n=1 Tax=Pontibacillus litoralis JSM 072002 TaxID=1385512 RepID=A0A0A5G2R1_9BACI|nr:acetylornithine deacetylase [Pontibacillus litoralis]KGX87376.1 acetylornithine deacetylase [Pontibacillus litoralis JSM 072002]